MTRFEARPLGLFLNCGYAIHDGSCLIAKIKFYNGFSSFLGAFDILGLSVLWDKGFRGRVITPSTRYRVQHRGKIWQGKIVLLEGKTPVSEVQEQFMPPGFKLAHNGKEYRLVPGENIGHQIIVDGKVAGYAKPPRSLFSRKVYFLMPNKLPLTSQLLLMWIYLDRFAS